MSRRARILRNIAIGLAAVLVACVIAAIAVVRTDWFRDFVKQKIISATEEGTGGKVEIQTFSFEWSHLRAIVTGFVIHGREPAGAAPFVRAARVELDLHLLSGLKHTLDVAYLGIDRPEVNISVSADGQTNIPTPTQKSTSNKTALETVVDLAVGRFELTNGALAFNSSKQPLNVRGNNLRAALAYNLLKQSYEGRVSLEPLYVISGRNTPVKFTIALPVELYRDRIELRDATIATDASRIVINASLENLRDPKTSAHVNGRIALTDVQNVANVPLALNGRNTPSVLDLDANATLAGNSVQVSALRVGLGHSTAEASGTLKDSRGNGALQFKAQLALGELGQLAKVTARPDGTLLLNGTARLDAQNNYQVNGNLEAKNVSFTQGTDRISNVNLFSAVKLDPHRLDLNGLRLAAFGGEFAGNASLEEFARYQVKGDLRHLDVRAAAGAAGQKQLPYDGSISGPLEASGDLRAPGTKSVVAHARLAIAPGRKGIPVSGRLSADYNGAADNIAIQDSYIALPHTRLNLSGSLGKQLNIALTTQDLNDLLAAAALKEKPPVTLDGGQATFTGVVTGSLTAPRITGHLTATRFSVEGRQFEALAADVNASASGAAVSNGVLSRGPMQAQFAASVGLKAWKATENQPLSAYVGIQHGDLADALALAGQPSTGYSGALTADANVSGTVGNPRGTATLQVANGTVQDEPFDALQAKVNLADQLVTIPSAYIAAGSARVNLTAEFQHPRDSFSTGKLHAHVQSNQVDLAQLRTLQKQRPNTAGVLQLNADVTGNLTEEKKDGKEQTAFLLTGVNGDTSAHGLRFDGQNYGDFNATARTSGQVVDYNVTSDFAGSSIHVNGNTRLTREYPTNADGSISNLPVERVLSVAQRTDIPARGNLSGKLHFQGTVEKPEGSVDVTLEKAVLYDEPVDQMHARVTYLAQSIDVTQFEAAAGPSRVSLTARYEHPADNLQEGNLQFRVGNSRIDLGRIHYLQTARPGLGGTVQMTADGAAAVHQADPRVLVRDLNAKIDATGISAQGKKFGDLNLTANTAGQRLNFKLDSNLASASIHGNGHTELSGDYPVTADLTFGNVAWTKLQELIGPTNGEPPSFEAVADGQATVNGPATKTDELRASLQVNKLQFSTIPAAGTRARPIVIQNQGPIVATLDRGKVRLESLHLTGPNTDIQAHGTATLKDQTVDGSLNASTDLSLAQSFNRDVVSSGGITVAATVRGTTTKPLINGRLELHNASVSYTEFPNGISNANGLVEFNGSSASVRNLTAESGGGKLTMGGFVAYRDNLRFGLRAEAASVRVRPQQGVSAVADANVSLTGTTDASVLSGTVTINQITYAPQSDFGSILSRAAPPVQVPTAPSPLLDNMKLDLRVRTSPSMAVQASLAQNLQADADLRVRGTASQPGVLGRITVNEGQLVFFGSSYTVNSGNISFYNPVRIEPILNVSLETKAKGVDVVLTVTGPIDNMKLSYTSDPPLQFQEIVALLASGKTPTSDPTILANQPSTPPQSFQQMGESALVSKALADPVSSRLQRVFGVSQLKIDPTFTSGSELPQARVTLQQQVSTNLTFTYVTALNDPNTQIIRVEWALNPQWSATATRDQNGIFNVSFFYKKQFH